MQKIVQHFSAHEVPLEYLQPLPCRYVRLRKPIPLIQLAASLGVQPHLVEPTPLANVVRLPAEIKLKGWKLYEEGAAAGIDYSSCLAVNALGLSGSETVLDLCCAPGAKLSYICDLAKHAVGVDISTNRLNTCRGLLRRQGISNFQLFNEDGCKFVYKDQFDAVLVDVQCTHEGSAKHLHKFKDSKQPRKRRISKGRNAKKQQKLNNSNIYCDPVEGANCWDEVDLEQRFFNKKKLQNLAQLQLELLQNGFRLLKPGGSLVYSTCSYLKVQNQDIIKKFIGDESNAVVVQAFPDYQSLGLREGGIEDSYRANPIDTKAGGMFICKLTKINKR